MTPWSVVTGPVTYDVPVCCEAADDVGENVDLGVAGHAPGSRGGARPAGRDAGHAACVHGDDRERAEGRVPCAGAGRPADGGAWPADGHVSGNRDPAVDEDRPRAREVGIATAHDQVAVEIENAGGRQRLRGRVPAQGAHLVPCDVARGLVDGAVVGAAGKERDRADAGIARPVAVECEGSRAADRMVPVPACVGACRVDREASSGTGQWRCSCSRTPLTGRSCCRSWRSRPRYSRRRCRPGRSSRRRRRSLMGHSWQLHLAAHVEVDARGRRRGLEDLYCFRSRQRLPAA